jgi:hypothetical protein
MPSRVNDSIFNSRVADDTLLLRIVDNVTIIFTLSLMAVDVFNFEEFVPKQETLFVEHEYKLVSAISVKVAISNLSLSLILMVCSCILNAWLRVIYT